MAVDYQIIKPGNTLVAPFSVTVTKLDKPQPARKFTKDSIDILVSGSSMYESPIPELHKRFFGGSTVAYVTDGEKKLIVDTGFEKFNDTSDYNKKCNEMILRGFLRVHRLDFDDIDLVFLTHNHTDHINKAYLFEFAGADIVYARHVKEGDEIIKGVNVIDTPGHTPEHKSLVFERLSKDFVIAGDAVIDEAYFRMGHVYYGNGYDDEQIAQARRSMERIEGLSDYIIPGHGAVFANDKRTVESEIRAKYDNEFAHWMNQEVMPVYGTLWGELCDPSEEFFMKMYSVPEAQDIWTDILKTKLKDKEDYEKLAQLRDWSSQPKKKGKEHQFSQTEKMVVENSIQLISRGLHEDGEIDNSSIIREMLDMLHEYYQKNN